MPTFPAKFNVNSTINNELKFGATSRLIIVKLLVPSVFEALTYSLLLSDNAFDRTRRAVPVHKNKLMINTKVVTLYFGTRVTKTIININDGIVTKKSINRIMI